MEEGSRDLGRCFTLASQSAAADVMARRPITSRVPDALLQYIQRNVCAEGLPLAAVSAEYFYLASVPLSPLQAECLRKLLTAPPPWPTVADTKVYEYYVLPRPGTRPPWSDKACEVLQHMGVSLPLLVRGIHWHLSIPVCHLLNPDQEESLQHHLYDRMIEQLYLALDVPYTEASLGPLLAPLTMSEGIDSASPISSSACGFEVLQEARQRLGLALSDADLCCLQQQFVPLRRGPTETELMMFAQVNSEHCRHRIFNAHWQLGEKPQPHSPFAMIRATHTANPGVVLSAYCDNAAVMQGYRASRFFPDPESHLYGYHNEDVHLLMKVETHNHPTAISPYAGAATGVGGELRDEAATGRGGRPKAGLCGFVVSPLRIPGHIQAWEEDFGQAPHLHSPLSIMLQAPVGAARYHNEFGRPALAGYFRSFAQRFRGKQYGYHKPIMLAGGYGMIRPPHVHRCRIPPGACIAVLGGPAMRIGLGGGTASSQTSHDDNTQLDFASVQRDNAEMQRRCQEVIDACCALGAQSPVLAIHDVGAGGLANAIPELVHNSGLGADLELSRIPCADRSMSPMELWCNESQERYVLAVLPADLPCIVRLCQRERAPFAVLGKAIEDERLVLRTAPGGHLAVDMPTRMLFDTLPRRTIHAVIPDVEDEPASSPVPNWPDNPTEEVLMTLAAGVLRLPSVAAKDFLVTIGDRSISGLVARDQMVGPWQVPVADCAVTTCGYERFVGEAMALGERPPIAVYNAVASARMAVGEALTNLCAARVLHLEDVALSANWMAAGDDAEAAGQLFEAVQAVRDLAIGLGICIPVGKDSLSMKSRWHSGSQCHEVLAPLSLSVTAFARVADTRLTLTPMLRRDEETCLYLIDLGVGQCRLGASALAQSTSVSCALVPDVDETKWLKAFFHGVQLLNEAGLLLAYHDRSDGGLLAAVCEMAFAGRCGVDLELDGADLLADLFNEELGAVVQLREQDEQTLRCGLRDAGLPSSCIRRIGKPRPGLRFRIHQRDQLHLDQSLLDMQQIWAHTSRVMQSLRDDPDCAQEAWDGIQDARDPGLSMPKHFTPPDVRPFFTARARPKVAVLREQGVNGHSEMAAAFDRAGFSCMDLPMQALIDGAANLRDFHGLAVAGGFSYGDVFGAGRGWAHTVVAAPKLAEQFSDYFTRPDTFTLGVCNGCQMLAELQSFIPGAGQWPRFTVNRSRQFEARLVMVEVLDSPAIVFSGMTGIVMPVVVAHGEGRVATCEGVAGAVLRYVDHYGQVTARYPYNPNGSVAGWTGFTSQDGRATILMPHPERVFMSRQLSWCPPDWHHEYTPWMQLFINARNWLG